MIATYKENNTENKGQGMKCKQTQILMYHVQTEALLSERAVLHFRSRIRRIVHEKKFVRIENKKYEQKFPQHSRNPSLRVRQSIEYQMSIDLYFVKQKIQKYQNDLVLDVLVRGGIAGSTSSQTNILRSKHFNYLLTRFSAFDTDHPLNLQIYSLSLSFLVEQNTFLKKNKSGNPKSETDLHARESGFSSRCRCC